MDQTNLVEAQRDLESRSTAEGYDRYLKQQKSTSDNEGSYATLEAMRIIKRSIPLVSKEILRWLETANQKGKGRTHTAFATLSNFDPDTLAFVALNGVFTGVTAGYSVTKVQSHIGTVIEAEVYAKEIEEARGKATANRIAKIVAKQGGSRNRTKVFSKLAKEALADREPWGNDFKVRIGEPLVNAVLLTLSEIFEIHMVDRYRKRLTIIRLTEEGTQLLSTIRESVAWNQPIHRPMVVKPRPWVSMHTGCYYDEKAAHNVKLVRTFNKDHKKAITAAIDSGQMKYVLEAVNTVQETPWAINQQVLSVLTWAWTNDISIPGMPQRKLVDLPPRKEPEVWEAMGPTGRKGHRLNIAGLREKNRSIVGDTAVMLRDLDTAKELSRFERFYLPHNLDFRGRVYPVCHFSHQRADHIKALFSFGDGCPFGEFGAAWLSVHLANCGDFERVSKRPFADRLAWVESNEDLILRVARDPTGTVPEWSAADKPFMFLAACFEYAGWVDGGRSDLFMSRLPVALDGSNSGLQHYSAALRAADEAALVSLCPCEQPADLYQTVADLVRRWVEGDAELGHPLATTVLQAGGITRSLVKRNVMTFAYSSEQYGFRQQLLTDTMAPLNEMVLLGKAPSNPYDTPRVDPEGHQTGEMDGGFAASGYLSKLIYRAVTSIVHKATLGMQFFKDVSGVLAHEGKPMTWVTPVGLPVVHRYDVWNVKQVKLMLFDRSATVDDIGSMDKLDEDGRGVIRRVMSTVRTTTTGVIDKDKARSAIAPNVIHSMDGSHLLLTVLAASGIGMSHFALIHDSFGTHAGRTQEFFQVIREAFVEMYEGYCPFEEVLEQAKAVLSDEGIARLPSIPEKGTLDLEQVLDALYAFA